MTGSAAKRRWTFYYCAKASEFMKNGRGFGRGWAPDRAGHKAGGFVNCYFLVLLDPLGSLLDPLGSLLDPLRLHFEPLRCNFCVNIMIF